MLGKGGLEDCKQGDQTLPHPGFLLLCFLSALPPPPPTATRAADVIPCVTRTTTLQGGPGRGVGGPGLPQGAMKVNRSFSSPSPVTQASPPHPTRQQASPGLQAALPGPPVPRPGLTYGPRRGRPALGLPWSRLPRAERPAPPACFLTAPSGTGRDGSDAFPLRTPGVVVPCLLDARSYSAPLRAADYNSRQPPRRLCSLELARFVESRRNRIIDLRPIKDEEGDGEKVEQARLANSEGSVVRGDWLARDLRP